MRVNRIFAGFTGMVCCCLMLSACNEADVRDHTGTSSSAVWDVTQTTKADNNTQPFLGCANGCFGHLPTVTSDNGWVYFSHLTGIYRMKADGTQKKWLFDANNDDIITLNAKNGLLYFFGKLGEEKGLIRLNPDTLDATMLVKAGYIDGRLIGDDFYYTKADDEPGAVSKLYRLSLTTNVSTETPNREMLKSYENVVGNQIYFKYADYDDLKTFGNICRAPLDGGQRTVIRQGEADCLCVENGWMYFIDVAQNSALYRCKLDGTKEEKLSSRHIEEMSADQNAVYYISKDDNRGKLYRFDLATREEKMICDHYVFNVAVTDGCVFHYHAAMVNGSLFAAGGDLWYWQANGNGDTQAVTPKK